MQIWPCPLQSLLVAYTKGPSSFCTRDLAWKCFSRWVLQLPVPKLLSIIHQFSCCFMLPCFMLLFPGFATPSPSGAHSRVTKGPRAWVGTHPLCTYTLFGYPCGLGAVGMEVLPETQLKHFPLRLLFLIPLGWVRSPFTLLPKCL